MIDRFADGNPDNIDEIADLGATAIWITPIALQIDHPTQAEGKDFYPHHGYWAEDLTKIDPRYGTEADLIALTDAAHERSMKIILDVVYNHMGFGASMTTAQPEWLRQGDECGGDPITLCLAGLPDLRTEDPEIQQFLFDAHIGLAERTGLDGFRQLITLRKEYPSLREDAYEVLYSDKDVLIYLRGSDAIIAINRNSTPQEIQIEGVAEGIWTLAFTSMPDTQTSLLSLPARSARFLSKPLNERIIAGRIIEAAAER